ncbi:MAG: DUF998 domain-containing protein [Thermoplasmataceae archaeon]
MADETISGKLMLSGIAAIISAFAWIATAMLLNPGFDFFTGALSQLGSPGSNFPWVYNMGLMFTSVLLFIFACGLLLWSRNKVESAGSSFFMIAALFLALIGIYHGGTYPHDFVSLWFFIIADLAIIVWGFGMTIESRARGGYILLLAAAATGIAFGISWPSSAELETFGTCAISLWALLMIGIRRADRISSSVTD